MLFHILPSNVQLVLVSEIDTCCKLFSHGRSPEKSLLHHCERVMFPRGNQIQYNMTAFNHVLVPSCKVKLCKLFLLANLLPGEYKCLYFESVLVPPIVFFSFFLSFAY